MGRSVPERAARQRRFSCRPPTARGGDARVLLMLTYMLDTNICIYVMKAYPPALREKFNELAEQLCISSITLGELHYGAEKSARRVENLTAIEHFVARLEVLPFAEKAAAHYGQVRAELERAGTPCGPHDMQIGGHARSDGLVVVTNNMREFARMAGVRAARHGQRPELGSIYPWKPLWVGVLLSFASHPCYDNGS